MKPSLSAAVALLAAGAGLLTFTSGIVAAPATNGADLYSRNCAMCHGMDGRGFPSFKTPDFTDPEAQAALSDREIIEAIKNGKKGTAMPAFKDKLKDEDVHALLVYLRSLGRKK